MSRITAAISNITSGCCEAILSRSVLTVEDQPDVGHLSRRKVTWLRHLRESKMRWKTKALFNSGPATQEAITKLKLASPVELPQSYLEFLKFSNSGEWDLELQPFVFVSDSAETVTSSIANREYEEFFSGFIMIGSNGAGEYISFDIRKNRPWPVVAIDMTNIDLSQSVLHIALDFKSFLDHLGIEPPEESI